MAIALFRSISYTQYTIINCENCFLSLHFCSGVAALPERQSGSSPGSRTRSWPFSTAFKEVAAFEAYPFS